MVYVGIRNRSVAMEVNMRKKKNQIFRPSLQSHYSEVYLGPFLHMYTSKYTQIISEMTFKERSKVHGKWKKQGPEANDASLG